MQSSNGNLDNQSSLFDKLAVPTDTLVTPISYTEGTIAPSPYFPHEMKSETEVDSEIIQDEGIH